jgi:hypothetical protein
MPSNDTENIYSTQFNEGEAQPIPATRIGYDNTASGLSATNVQTAIDELAEVKNKYILTVYNHPLTVTADGVKSIGDLFTELNGVLMSYVGTLEDDERCMPIDLLVAGAYLNVKHSDVYTNQSTSASPAFNATNCGTDKVEFFLASLNLSNIIYRCAVLDSTGVTFSDLVNNVLPVGRKVTIFVDVYKQV